MSDMKKLIRNYSTHRYLNILSVILLFLIQACTSTQPPLISLQSSQPTATSEPIEIEPLTTVTFQVEVPVNTPPGQTILLSILDEVTGLALNISRREMENIADSTYSITLPFPVGANIKYRYARQDAFIAEEHTTDNRPVRYRLYRVDGPGIVNDIVSSWSDGSYVGLTGRIMGKVTNKDDGTPIPNLLVTAGGAQTVTSSTGDYLLEGLPPGLHNLVLYAFDGAYETYQQGAIVAGESTTPANVQLTPAPLVKLIFTATAPEGTLPAVPIRLAGNLEQLGNTFADLSGGINTLAARMPTLTQLTDGRYALEIELPASAFLEYKYTLGDGFWNAEYTPNGDFRVRKMTVPETDTVIEDRIDNWGDLSVAGPILFDLSVPSSTPDNDYISIQFNPFGWTEPIPMWKLGEDHWVYMLYSPITNMEDFIYRYCRNDQCGRADDSLTPGANPPGRKIKITGGTQTVEDKVDSWFWLQPGNPNDQFEFIDLKPRSEGYISGVQFQPYFHPSYTPRLPITYREISNLQAKWLFLSPTWTFTRQTPPVFEPVTGIDQSWSDLSFAIEKAQSFELNVGYNPTPNFPQDMVDWWSSAPRDFPWWQVWFERYRNFILSFADKAQQDGANGLVLGGEWVIPALPSGMLPDGTPSGVPLDAEQRWREIVTEVRERFQGKLFWALPASKTGINPPPFIEELDHIYLLWSLPLSDQPDATRDQLIKNAEQYLDNEVFLLNISLEMPITIVAEYPSAEGSLQGCIPVSNEAEQESCLNQRYLEPPYQDNPAVTLDLNEQLSAYQALLSAISGREWIDGFVSAGFYPPAELRDKSASIYGKPTQPLLQDWFGGVNSASQP
jgi:hypothetical protein